MKLFARSADDGRRGGRKGVLAVGLVLGVLAVAAAFWLVSRRPGPAPGGSAKPAPGAASSPLARPSAGPAAGTGTIEITADAAGARVLIDGRAFGPAPQNVDAPGGAHRVRVEKEGLEPFEREVHVVPGHRVRIDARLSSPPPVLRVDADVPGASVFVDRKFVGTAPVVVRNLAPGSHRVNVSAEGEEMFAETLDLGSGTRELMVRFKEVRLDERIEVAHKHGVGSCRGRLIATVEGFRYETDHSADAFGVPHALVRRFEVDYVKKNLRLEVKGGRTYNFTASSADALLTFHKTVEAARKRL